ncbi:hypothetical protein K501DRAFT_329564 [Backusella circina FSU 941]|nr:hypothetical protein K501DRAFT_329564 [Backusella circina FSU 941]
MANLNSNTLTHAIGIYFKLKYFRSFYTIEIARNAEALSDFGLWFRGLEIDAFEPSKAYPIFPVLDTIRSRVKEIATQVIKDGENAVLKLETLLKLITKTKKCSMVDTILSKIRDLFKDQDQITIIGNTLLNSQLTDLADSIKNKRENDKKIELISKALYD